MHTGTLQKPCRALVDELVRLSREAQAVRVYGRAYFSLQKFKRSHFLKHFASLGQLKCFVFYLKQSSVIANLCVILIKLSMIIKPLSVKKHPLKARKACGVHNKKSEGLPMLITVKTRKSNWLFRIGPLNET